MVVVFEQPEPGLLQLRAPVAQHRRGQEREVARGARPSERASRGEHLIEVVIGEPVADEEDGVSAEERLEDGAVQGPAEGGLVVLLPGKDPGPRIDPRAVELEDVVPALSEVAGRIGEGGPVAGEGALDEAVEVSGDDGAELGLKIRRWRSRRRARGGSCRRRLSRSQG